MKLKLLLDQLAGDLNDNEEGHAYTTWTEKDIRAWIEEGLSLIFDKRPDLFLELRVIKVSPCTTRQSSCDCDTIRRVIGQTTESGRLLRQLRKRSLDMQIQWTAPVCRRHQPGNGFVLDGYAIDSVGDTLYLYPEVPPGEDVYVQVECAVRPTMDMLDNDVEIPSDTTTALKQWVLFRAKIIDAELAAPILSVATLHKTTFYEVLGIQESTSVVIHKRADA